MKLDAVIPATAKLAPPPHVGAAVVDLFIRNPVVGVVDGLNAAIGQAHEERAAEKEKEEIRRKILTLDVAEKLQQQWRLQLQACGWRLERGRKAEHPYGKPDYTYTAVWRDGTELALMQLPPGVFATDENEYDLYVSDFAKMLKAFRDKPARLFAEGTEGIRFAFDVALLDESKGADWRFIPWADVVALGKAKLEFWQAFKLPKPDLVAGHAAVPRRAVSDDQLRQIKAVLVRLANDYTSSDVAFKSLVGESGWPPEWKNARLTGWTNQAPTDAGTFVEYMVRKSTFPAGHDLAGRSVLGEFLGKLLMANALGGEDADTLARIVVECALVPDALAFKKFYK